MMVTIGIDLGTTNTACCYINESGSLSSVKFNSKQTLPSVLLYERNKVFVGSEAKAKSVIRSERYIESSKTFIGSLEPLKEIDGRSFNPTDVATEILKRVKTAVKDQLNCNDEIKAVITVPAYFESSQKRETRKAGEDAGFIVDTIIHEPSAAAIAYASTKINFKNVYVIDIGGGTFDVAFIEKHGDIYDEKIVYGDSKLGGDDFNKVIYDMICRHILEECGVNFNSYQECRNSIESEAMYLSICQKLRNIAENVKIQLSSMENHNIGIPSLFMNTLTNQPFNLDYTITRAMFEEKSEHLFEKIENIIRKSFTDEKKNPNGYSISDVEIVLFMGGSSAIPKLSEIVYDIFGKKPESSIDLSKGVAMGAALVCYNNENIAKGVVGIKKMEYHELLAHSIGTSAWTGRRIPGLFSEILKQGSKYPVSETKRYLTIADNQKSMLIDIIEGNNKYAIDNTYYADFTVYNLTERPRGKTAVEVTYSLDFDGILHISAKEVDNDNSLTNFEVDISESKDNPLKRKYTQKYKNIFLFNTNISEFKEFGSDTFEVDYKYAVMKAVYDDVCIFSNPSTLIYNGDMQEFTTDPEVFVNLFESYYSDNALSDNYYMLDGNIECVRNILRSSPNDNYNIFVISDDGIDISNKLNIFSNAKIYYIDYNLRCMSAGDNRFFIESIKDLEFEIYKICKNNFWNK